jgi:hypothetical protein
LTSFLSWNNGQDDGKKGSVGTYFRVKIRYRVKTMIINSIGLLTAITTILTIAFGHIMVRELEYRIHTIKPAITICIFLGIGLEIGALLSDSRTASAILGIIGITFLWDGLEFYRQQKRVIKGHAPANPDNPRHQRILSQYPIATTVNILDRDPRGYPYSEDEIQNILKGTGYPQGEQRE